MLQGELETQYQPHTSTQGVIQRSDLINLTTFVSCYYVGFPQGSYMHA